MERPIILLTGCQRTPEQLVGSHVARFPFEDERGFILGLSKLPSRQVKASQVEMNVHAFGLKLDGLLERGIGLVPLMESKIGLG